MSNPATQPDPLDGMFNAASLIARNFPPLEYVVPGVIPEGLTMLVAPPKIGKSWMVLGLAKACSEGGEAFDAITVDQRPVMYLALEDGERRLKDRLLTLGMDSGNSDLNMMTEILAGPIETIGAYVERHAQRKPLVILDTLGKVRDVYAGNDAYQKDYRQMSELKKIVDDYPGSSLIVVHHTNKGTHGDFVASVSGTQGITGAADSVLTIERSRAEGNATLNVTSRDAAEGSYAITLNDGAWTLDGKGLAEAARQAQTHRTTEGLGDPMTQVVAEVNKHPEGIKSADVATLVKMEPGTVRTYLSRAYDSNRVQKLQRGLYAPVTSAATVASAAVSLPERNTNNTCDTDTERVQQVPTTDDTQGQCWSCGTALTPYLQRTSGACFECATNTDAASA